MIVSAYIKVIGRILKDLAHICVRSHRIVTYHAADNSVSRISLDCRMISGEVRTIGIVIPSVCFMNAAVLKHTGSVNHLRDSVFIICKTCHVIGKFHDSCALWIQILSFRYAAAERQITGSVVVYHNRRVKYPRYALHSRSASGDKSLFVRITPRAYRRIAFQNSDSSAAVAEIQEELIHTVNLLVGNSRRP